MGKAERATPAEELNMGELAQQNEHTDPFETKYQCIVLPQIVTLCLLQFYSLDFFLVQAVGWHDQPNFVTLTL